MTASTALASSTGVSAWPSGDSFLSSSSSSWQPLSTTALEFLLSWSTSSSLIFSCSMSSSFLAILSKPLALSALTVIQPGLLTPSSSLTMPSFRSAAISDCTRVAVWKDEKLSTRVRMFCLARFMTSIWKTVWGCSTSVLVSCCTSALGSLWSTLQG